MPKLLGNGDGVNTPIRGFSRGQQSASKLLEIMACLIHTKPAARRPRARRWALSLLAALIAMQTAVAQTKSASAAAPAGKAILWTDPGDIRSKDLFYGVGGKEHMPELPVRFIDEEKGGGSPKFNVKDSAGKKWRAKVGIEAQPETVASRLLWAVGYVANENYLFPDLVVADLPPHLSRGNQYVHPGGHVTNVRLQRHPEGEHKGKKEANWQWKHNPFTGTREFNGLRVMMALISNWDIVTNNTAIREGKDGEMLYQVSDVGSTFGKNGRGFSDKTSENNLEQYAKAKFITKITPDYVDFAFPSRPPFIYIFDVKMWRDLAGPHWIGKHVPRADVKWIASLLGQLTPQQVRDAFRAGGYTPDEVEGFAKAVEARIAALQQL